LINAFFYLAALAYAAGWAMLLIYPSQYAIAYGQIME
jgi:hypothetical protein